MSANKIRLTKNDESVLFTFTDSKHYLTGNGRIEVPLNSLSLVIDSSDMVTFRKAASNDIFVSAPISDFGMSKAELEDWYAENMVGGVGGSSSGLTPQEVEEMIDEAVSGKQDALEYYTEEGEQALIEVPSNNGANGVDIFNNGVNIYAHEDQVGETDVYVSPTGVTINDDPVVTESTLDEYATVGELSDKADTSAVTAAIDAAKAYYIDFGVLTTQGIHDADWDGMVAAINAHRPIYAGVPGTNGLLYYTAECLYQDGSNIIRMTASDNSAHYFYTFTKNGSEDYSFSYQTRPYTTDAEKAAWNAKADVSAVTAISDSLSGKQDTLIAGSGITISGNVISADGGASDPNKLDVTAFTAYSAATATAISGKANASDVVSISDYDESQRVTATALNDLNDRFGGMTLRKLTQAQYDALVTKDDNTLYIITNVVNNNA